MTRTGHGPTRAVLVKTHLQDTPAVGGGGVPVGAPLQKSGNQAVPREGTEVCLAAGGRGLQGLLIFFPPLQAPGEPTLWENPPSEGCDAGC